MSVQRKHHTVSSKKRRRSHMHIKKQVLSVCKYCGERKQSHRTCAKCNKY